MQARLTRVGDELALILDPTTWKVSGIDDETELEVEVDEGGIHVRPSLVGARGRVIASARRMMEIHEETFRKLAL